MVTDEQFAQLKNRIDALERITNPVNFQTKKLDVQLLGTVTARTIGTSYQAGSNVFVYASFTADTASVVDLEFRTDTVSTPTTVVWRALAGTSHGTDAYSFMYPVRKGNYYRLVDSGTSTTVAYQEISISKY